MLASSLFDTEVNRQRTAYTLGPWRTGLTNIDTSASPGQDLWKSGQIIAVSGATLINHIVAQILSSPPDSSLQSPAAFIITSRPLDRIADINEILTDASQERDPSSPLSILDNVQILQYLDFAGLAESVSEVATKIPGFARTILVVDDLIATAETTQRQSGRNSANALLVSLLRNIARISRAYASVLIVLSVELIPKYIGGEGMQSAFSSGPDVCISPDGPLGRSLEDIVDKVVAVREWGEDNVVAEVIKDGQYSNLGTWSVLSNYTAGSKARNNHSF